jgi:subtilase-type serine protease
LCRPLGRLPRRSAEHHLCPLNYDNLPTFLTGIRGSTITGQYVIPNGGGNGGVIYSTTASAWIPFPTTTANGINFPGAIDNTPYGPSFGDYGGILRVVGSYQTSTSAPYDLSYLYDSSAPPGQNITYLKFPNPPNETTFFTIAHSTFGDQVVGNYDTVATAGDSFLYNISTGTYITTDKPGAYSTTSYGIYGNVIAGGYFDPGPGGGPGPGHAFLYNETTGAWTQYDYPGAAETHFEGITSGGQANTYNLAVDYVDASGVPHAAVLHIDAQGNTTWINLGISGAVVSANSIYQNEVLGVDVNATGGVQGYTALIPGIYNPITNAGTLTTTAANTAALTGASGDDILNNGTITTSGPLSPGISSNTYGVVTNNGSVNVTGAASAAVMMNGLDGTLLNNGTLHATPGSYALATGPDAVGSIAVNNGTIDGQVNFTAGPLARFENNGWLGISTPGVGATHVFSGVFTQTSAGTLSLRIAPGGASDMLQIGGFGLLAGNLVLAPQASGFQPGTHYTVVTAAGGLSGAFASATLSGIALLAPAMSYDADDAYVTLVQQSATTVATTPNQVATAGAVDAVIAGNPAVRTALDQLSLTQVRSALNLFSGETYAGAETAALDTSAAFITQITSQMNLIRQGVAAGSSDAQAAGVSGGRTKLVATTVLPGMLPEAQPAGWSVWMQGYGQSSAVPGDGNTSQLNSTLAGMSAGADGRINASLLLGGAIGYVSEISASMAAGRRAIAITGNSPFTAFTVLVRPMWTARSATAMPAAASRATFPRPACRARRQARWTATRHWGVCRRDMISTCPRRLC